MSPISSRAFLGASDLPGLIEFACSATVARLPAPTYYHPGDVVWQLYRAEPTGDVRLWLDSGVAVALGIYERPLNFHFEVLPGYESVERHILGWAEDLRAATPDDAETPIAYRMLGPGTLSTVSFESDVRRIEALAGAGYQPIERGAIRYAQDLADAIEPPSLPPGAVVRHATDADIEERADLHRDAWSVWGTSRFSANAYRRLREAPHYDEWLDVVVEYEGRLVSSCVCWADEVSGVGYFEPTGTRPSAAGMGFGRAAITEGLRRLGVRGMHTATTATASVNEPAQRLYESCGFRAVDRERFFSKQVR